MTRWDPHPVLPTASRPLHALHAQPRIIRVVGHNPPATVATYRADSDTEYLYCPGSPRNDLAEQFVAFPATSSSISIGQPIAPGSQIIIKSALTGECRVSCRVSCCGNSTR
jgi:hypothetical protein